MGERDLCSQCRDYGMCEFLIYSEIYNLIQYRFILIDFSFFPLEFRSQPQFFLKLPSFVGGARGGVLGVQVLLAKLADASKA